MCCVWCIYINRCIVKYARSPVLPCFGCPRPPHPPSTRILLHIPPNMKVKPHTNVTANATRTRNTINGQRQTASRQSAVVAAAAIAATKPRKSSSGTGAGSTSTTATAATARATPPVTIKNCYVDIDRYDSRMKRASLRTSVGGAAAVSPAPVVVPPPKKRGRPPRSDTQPTAPVAKAAKAGFPRSLHGLDTSALVTSKRQPKPNRRYVNEHTVAKATSTSSDEEEDEEAGVRHDDDEHTADDNDEEVEQASDAEQEDEEVDEEQEPEPESELDRSQDEEQEDEHGDDGEEEEDDDEAGHDNDASSHEEDEEEEEPATPLPTRRRAAAAAIVAAAAASTSAGKQKQLQHQQRPAVLRRSEPVVPTRGRGRPPLMRKVSATEVVKPKPAVGADVGRRRSLAPLATGGSSAGAGGGKRKVDYSSDSAGESSQPEKQRRPQVLVKKVHSIQLSSIRFICSSLPNYSNIYRNHNHPYAEITYNLNPPSPLRSTLAAPPSCNRTSTSRTRATRTTRCPRGHRPNVRARPRRPSPSQPAPAPAASPRPPMRRQRLQRPPPHRLPHQRPRPRQRCTATPNSRTAVRSWRPSAPPCWPR